MKLNIVPARHGILWVKQGVRAFIKQPLALIGLFFMFMAVMSIASLLPYVGSVLALMLLPGATLGLMAATKESSQGKFPMPLVLVSAFRAGSQRLRAMLALGAVMGFLLFNLRLPWRARAAIFMGDAGSMMLGFFLVWMAVDVTQGPGRMVPPMTAVWIIALPLLDMARVMFTRMRRGQSPFIADRIHLHHLLLARGLGSGQVVALMSGFGFTGGAIGIAAWRLGLPDWAMFYAFLMMLGVYGYALHRRGSERVG